MIGSVTLDLLGKGRRIIGGPFDDYRPPAIGVCLEVASGKAALATVMLPVADYAAPAPDDFVRGLAAVLRAMRVAPALDVYVGCRAGLGRTGTVIAGLAKLAGHHDPVGWTRRSYDPRAVETAVQEQAVAALDPAEVWDALREERA